VATILSITFLGSCLTLTVAIAQPLHQAGCTWPFALLAGSAAGVSFTWFGIWLLFLASLRLARVVNRSINWN